MEQNNRSKAIEFLTEIAENQREEIKQLKEKVLQLEKELGAYKIKKDHKSNIEKDKTKIYSIKEDEKVRLDFRKLEYRDRLKDIKFEIKHKENTNGFLTKSFAKEEVIKLLKVKKALDRDLTHKGDLIDHDDKDFLELKTSIDTLIKEVVFILQLNDLLNYTENGATTINKTAEEL